ncbi:MAG: hypothetical protein ACI9FN_004105 [Saprospiraceae bacterium]|jgi:hypothetical protein
MIINLSGSWNYMLIHRVRITETTAVDVSFIGYLKEP